MKRLLKFLFSNLRPVTLILATPPYFVLIFLSIAGIGLGNLIALIGGAMLLAVIIVHVFWATHD